MQKSKVQHANGLHAHQRNVDKGRSERAWPVGTVNLEGRSARPAEDGSRAGVVRGAKNTCVQSASTNKGQGRDKIYK